MLIVTFINDIIFSIICIIKLICNSLSLFNSDVIVLVPHAGFGHTLTCPDVARRIYPQKKIVILFFSEIGRHNHKVAKIINNLLLVFLPVGINRSKIKHYFPKLLYKVFSLFKSKTVVRDIFHFYPKLINNRIKKIIQLQPLINKEIFTNSGPWVNSYYNIMQENVGIKIKIPDLILNNFKERVNSNNNEIVSYYIRRKGKNSDPRKSSLLKEYYSSIELLIDKGYKVFLVGDVKIKDFPNKYHDKIFDHHKLKFNKNWYLILAVYISKLFVGDTGGGTWFSTIFDKPTLLLNSFPLFYCHPNSHVLPKHLYNRMGNPVPISDIFLHHYWDYTFDDGYTLECNKSEEILSATKEFLSHIQNKDWKGSLKTNEFIPNGTMLHIANSKICNKWIDIQNGSG